MKIVNGNLMFILVSCEEKTELNRFIELTLKTNVYLSTELNTENYKKLKLRIYGIQNPTLCINELKMYVNDYIDFEETENNKLDIWSDGIKVGVYEFDKYEEEINEYKIEDWIGEYKSLSENYLNQSKLHTKESILWTKFIDNLRFHLNKEIENCEIKNDFINKESETYNSNIKLTNLATKILNIIKEYKSE